MLEVAAPGMKKGDFKVNYENGRLTITAEKKAEHEENQGEKITRKEFNYQSFQRSFTVPENTVHTEKIAAKYNPARCGQVGCLKAALNKVRQNKK